MHRFFVPAAVEAGAVRLSEADAYQVTRVLRLAPGDRITVVNGGQAWTARLELAGKLVLARLEGPAPSAPEPMTAVTLAQALVKGDKLETVIQKATELGVAAVLPFVAERSVLRLDGKAGRRAERWRAVAEEAAEQSGRSSVPAVSDPVPFDEALQAARGHAAAILCHGGARLSLRAALPAARPATLLLAVGPEGGFSPAELEWATRAGLALAHLGPRVLRTETAGPAALAMALYQWGDLEGGWPCQP